MCNYFEKQVAINCLEIFINGLIELFISILEKNLQK